MLGVNGKTCPRSSADRPIGQLGKALLQSRRVLRRWQQDTRAVADLRALDARLLKDIGIERSEMKSSCMDETAIRTFEAYLISNPKEKAYP